MKQTDIQVSYNLAVSLAAKNNKARCINTEMMLHIFQQAIPILHALLDNANHPMVRVCPIAKKTRNGMYSQYRNTIEVDYSLSLKNALRVLCHEYIHWDQAQKGHLSYKIENNRVIRLWKDQPIFNKGTTHAAYLDLPWEIDARNREITLMEQVIQKMKENK